MIGSLYWTVIKVGVKAGLFTLAGGAGVAALASWYEQDRALVRGCQWTARHAFADTWKGEAYARASCLPIVAPYALYDARRAEHAVQAKLATLTS